MMSYFENTFHVVMTPTLTFKDFKKITVDIRFVLLLWHDSCYCYGMMAEVRDNELMMKCSTGLCGILLPLLPLAQFFRCRLFKKKKTGLISPSYVYCCKSSISLNVSKNKHEDKHFMCKSV